MAEAEGSIGLYEAPAATDPAQRPPWELLPALHA